MTTANRTDFRACVHGAFDGGLSRAAFFDGMVLNADDLLREQSYWRGKRRLTNRALGHGVVWGLGAQWDERTRRFCLAPGYALGCCGDDLVVSCAQTVDEKALIDRCSADFRRLLAHASGAGGLCDEAAQPDGPIEACLLLEYVECAEAPRAAIEDDCDSGQDIPCRYGAVRETTRLRLVPPPCPPGPGAIAAFCERIEAIRASLEGTPGAVIEPLQLQPAPAARLSLAYLGAGVVGGANTLAAADGELAWEAGATASLALAGVSGGPPAALRVGLEPPPGCVFVELTVGAVAKAPAEALMGAFQTYTPPPGAANEVKVLAHAAPLFGTQPGWRAVVTLRVTPAGNGSGNGSGNGVTLTATIDSLEQEDTRADCASLLAGGLLWRDGAACTGRTLALAGLCGWFVSQLGTAACGPAADEEPSAEQQARMLAAWSICRLAWRGLFGLDPALAPEAGLEKCLRQLFRAWCEGLVYKGPRCDGEAHGVVLGTLQLSPKGRVLCFDAWQHRRHVLTGPLLTHWGAQIGLAPPDQSVARLASWICCVARTPLTPPEDLEWPDLATLQLPGGVLATGRDFAVNDRAEGAVASAVKQVGGRDFVGELLGMLLGGTRPTLAGTDEFSVLTSGPGGLSLLAPRRAAAQAPAAAAPAAAAKAEALMAEIGMAGATVSPASRRVLRDFVAAYAESLPLTLLKPRPELPTFEPTVGALDAAGIRSVAELLALGPQAALDRVAPQLAGHAELADARSAEKAVALVYDSGVKALASAAQAVADRAREGGEADPFTRSDLGEGSTVAAVRKAANIHLRERGFSAADVRGIAHRAALPRA